MGYLIPAEEEKKPEEYLVPFDYRQIKNTSIANLSYEAERNYHDSSFDGPNQESSFIRR